jgi:hypothetical protein
MRMPGRRPLDSGSEHPNQRESKGSGTNNMNRFLTALLRREIGVASISPIYQVLVTGVGSPTLIKNLANDCERCSR